MKTVFLSPHNDDEVLFGAFTLLRHNPIVVICLSPVVQEIRGGPVYEQRVSETERAMDILGITEWRQWTQPDALDLRAEPIRRVELAAIKESMIQLDHDEKPELVFAPVVYDQLGHFDHDEIGRMAMEVYGDRVCGYHTYRRGTGRVADGEVVQAEPGWYGRKFAAMACYQSQIEWHDTRYWFCQAGMEEYRTCLLR